MNRELTREEAIILHRQMWTDMQAELGDNPSYQERVEFKGKWIDEHFPNERVNSDCFLCEYAQSVTKDSFTRCRECPIAWNSGLFPNCKSDGADYRYSPISVILAFPEREVTK